MRQNQKDCKLQNVLQFQICPTISALYINNLSTQKLKKKELQKIMYK